ncbi:PX domain-containing protein [Drepanopeziza brunnea f. sp. 'multigermtubi' MB_m1]|uniref:PX domain-containing protein n=1 Tax=Marssonina brunnea f. sp. multigermtubi (strain MB_m1) TaxID=1072389 RepID=K1WJK6_MARBU|nr:PX domain-containing protein [Drepanopeziza brunnea f. sp. 'multigermtubi' MB_m1]EKD12417.1 PX domain-containing protein [Drepanopeziza brunnea f. sp. 'multigermtubi' MB_m1]
MAPPIELSIPSTILSSDQNTKPYTLYNISLRLPLRTFVIQKRYSDFVTLNSSLASAVSSPPPATLPAKSWFKSTASSPELTETRRKGLEEYLRAIAECPDKRWRETSVWRSFLNLPSSSGGGSSVRKELVQANQRLGVRNPGQVASDPGVWLDLHREMKGQLHDARLFLGRRDGATNPQAQHEAGANAKRCLVKAGALLGNLEEGLQIMGEGDKRGYEAKVGAGELRRRRDLLGSAKVEKEGLEKLAVSLAVKGQHKGNGIGSTAATQQDKDVLFGPNVSRPSGRVLGAPVPETDKTRELGNEGVLQLQKQLMVDQDLDVDELAKIVRRQKEMGLAIHGELELQNEMLKRVDEDVDRLGGKINIAKKRIGKIS